MSTILHAIRRLFFRSPNLQNCVDDTIILSLNVSDKNATIEWIGTDLLDTRGEIVRFLPKKAGVFKYSVRSQNAFGCVGQFSDTETVLAKPDVLVSVDTQRVCLNDIVRINHSGAKTYKWQNPTDAYDVIETTRSFSRLKFKKPGEQRLILNSDTEGCVSSDTFKVLVQTRISPSVRITLDSCLPNLLVFKAKAQNVGQLPAYFWRFQNAVVETRDSVFRITNPPREGIVSVALEPSSEVCTTANNTLSDNFTFRSCLTNSQNEDFKNQNIQIFPNPSPNGFFTVTFKGFDSEPIAYQLYNAVGQTIIAQVLPEFSDTSQTVFDFSKLSKGVYFLVLNIENQFITKKIVVGY
ncbi:MAG: T9SS type A sorting domain-containing protein [Saprospiraceae bacterium]|nr:T9SS type A sorting domain-containing protein [Saprospiraceae bacterium]